MDTCCCCCSTGAPERTRTTHSERGEGCAGGGLRKCMYIKVQTEPAQAMCVWVVVVVVGGGVADDMHKCFVFCVPF
jgi:hypothetical protein